MKKIYSIILSFLLSFTYYSITFAQSSEGGNTLTNFIIPAVIVIAVVSIGFMIVKKLFSLAIKVAFIVGIILLILNYESILGLFI
ncbi:MAG: hypothetical protein ABF289_07590 [Clostridiales bacterium]